MWKGFLEHQVLLTKKFSCEGVNYALMKFKHWTVSFLKTHFFLLCFVKLREIVLNNKPVRKKWFSLSLNSSNDLDEQQTALQCTIEIKIIFWIKKSFHWKIFHLSTKNIQKRFFFQNFWDFLFHKNWMDSQINSSKKLIQYPNLFDKKIGSILFFLILSL